jgi:hypothetical protein
LGYSEYANGGGYPLGLERIRAGEGYTWVRANTSLVWGTHGLERIHVGGGYIWVRVNTP